MKMYIYLLISLSLLLVGCTYQYTDESRGYTYKLNGGEFNCTQKPSETEIVIKEAVLSSNELRVADKNEPPHPQGFPSPEELVTLCIELLNSK